MTTTLIAFDRKSGITMPVTAELAAVLAKYPRYRLRKALIVREKVSKAQWVRGKGVIH